MAVFFMETLHVAAAAALHRFMLPQLRGCSFIRACSPLEPRAPQHNFTPSKAQAKVEKLSCSERVQIKVEVPVCFNRCPDLTNSWIPCFFRLVRTSASLSEFVSFANLCTSGELDLRCRSGRNLPR